MKIVINSGRHYFQNFTEIKDSLEAGNYTVKIDENRVFYLEKTPDFKIPEKVYGFCDKDAERYLKAFDRGGNLGILLTGEKGSGKTLLSKMICVKSKLPVIQIDAKFTGVDFFTLINNINQKVIVLIDEFDKIYTENEDEEGINPQLELLKLMDGGFESQKMFIFTSNENRVSQFMTNRPSRIRYKQEFGKMTDDVIREVLEDKLTYKEYVEDFIELGHVFMGFNLDTLLVLIDEVNFTNESPKTVIKRMNIIPENRIFSITLHYNGVEYVSHSITEENPTDIDYFQDWWFNRHINDKKSGLYDFDFDNQLSNYDGMYTKEGIIFTHKDEGYKVIFKKMDKSKLVF